MNSPSHDALRAPRWQAWLDPKTWPGRVEHAREVLAFAVRRAAELRLAQVAGSLTFTTVLALVPLLAVVLSIFTMFPMFDQLRVSLEKNLLRELLPDQYAAVLLRYLNDFASKAARLTAFGLVVLLFAAMTMIATVDRVLNEIWHVRQQRPLAQRILVYWALITLGPIVIGASLAVTSYVVTLSAARVQQLPGVLRAVLDYFPLVLSGFAYSALYVFVPNRRVEWKDALVGGFAAAIAGDLIRDGFAVYIRTGVVTTIYGAFAAVPLFLIWVFLAWLVILLGAAIAATIPALRTTRFADQRRVGNDFYTAVALLRVLHHALGTPHPERSSDQLSRETRTDLDDTERLLPVIEQLGYVRHLAGSHAGRWRFVADPGRVTLRPLFDRLALDPANTLLAREGLGLAEWVPLGGAVEWLDRPLARVDPPPRTN